MESKQKGENYARLKGPWKKGPIGLTYGGVIIEL